MKLNEKFIFFKTHIEMFLPNPTYDQVVAFLEGMNYLSNGIFLENFESWICEKFHMHSEFYWGKLIENIYIENDRFKSKIDFLLFVVDEFLAKQEE